MKVDTMLAGRALSCPFLFSYCPFIKLFMSCIASFDHTLVTCHYLIRTRQLTGRILYPLVGTEQSRNFFLPLYLKVYIIKCAHQPTGHPSTHGAVLLCGSSSPSWLCVCSIHCFGSTKRSCDSRCSHPRISYLYNKGVYSINRLIWLWNWSSNSHSRTSLLFVCFSPLAGANNYKYRYVRMYAQWSPSIWTPEMWPLWRVPIVIQIECKYLPEMRPWAP